MLSPLLAAALAAQPIYLTGVIVTATWAVSDHLLGRRSNVMGEVACAVLWPFAVLTIWVRMAQLVHFRRLATQQERRSR